jgi:hypothetical protein
VSEATVFDSETLMEKKSVATGTNLTFKTLADLGNKRN